MRFENAMKFAGSLNRYVLLIALGKAAIAGAGLALAALASIDFAIAVVAKEAWDAWQVDQLVNKAALFGGAVGVLLQIAKVTIFR